MDLKEYKRITGQDYVDIGSKALLLKQIKKYARKKGYKLGGFDKMPIKQLYRIYQKLSSWH